MVHHLQTNVSTKGLKKISIIFFMLIVGLKVQLRTHPFGIGKRRTTNTSQKNKNLKNEGIQNQLLVRNQRKVVVNLRKIMELEKIVGLRNVGMITKMVMSLRKIMKLKKIVGRRNVGMITKMVMSLRKKVVNQITDTTQMTTTTTTNQNPSSKNEEKTTRKTMKVAAGP